MNKPFISICIPCYKHPQFLKRLLDSVLVQTFRDFEVIISDDSPDDSVLTLIQSYSEIGSITYFRNVPALGTPANWNAAMGRAKGEWIKLMHDDDWFSSVDSLADFVSAINSNPGKTFLFSAYRNVDADNSFTTKSSKEQESYSQNLVKPENYRITQMQINPVSLLSRNIIGPPSVVIHKNDGLHFYDEKLKWLVDMDFYIRYLNDSHPAFYIDKPLIDIGINAMQVTRESSLVREVEIPEHFRILEKTGVLHLQNMLVYDAWWRLFRNLKIRSVEDIIDSGFKGKVPVALLHIISFQNRFSYTTLKIGSASKSLMLVSYLYNRARGNFH